MKRKRPTAEEKLSEAARRALNGENLVTEEHGNAAKPLSFYPLTVEQAVGSLLKVKPPPRKNSGKKKD